jgi:hypothetical protein
MKKSSWFSGIEDAHLNKILTERASKHEAGRRASSSCDRPVAVMTAPIGHPTTFLPTIRVAGRRGCGNQTSRYA